VCTHLKYISKQARDSLGLFLELRSHFSWCVYVFWGGGCLACLVLLGPACLGVDGDLVGSPFFSQMPPERCH
jgi:hypothetical protein